MKYEIGDKIIVLHSKEEGKVIDIINDKMVMIEVRGVRFPAYMDQIDFPYFTMFSQAPKPVQKKVIYVDQVKPEKKTIRKKGTGGVFISFLPVLDKDVFDDDIIEKLKVYLVNQNEEGYSFKYELVFGGEVHFQIENKVDGVSEFYLHDVNFEDMNDSPRFDFEFSQQKPVKGKVPFQEVSFKLKAKQLFRKIEETRQKQEATFAYPLFQEFPEKVEVEKMDLSKLNKAGFRMYEISKGKDYLPPARSVIDLHIEKLTEQPSRLSAREMLELQLSTFEKYFELAVLHQLPVFTVIHGIGEGVLREALHENLKLKKEVSSFVNQHHPLYGYGATEIFFKKNS